ncbi:hypothetical protein RHMOL_Rhmol11G0193000 [Rhododendron molle]|uniref:Uncharacterized protein n=2 Tax=Rhododendron molle TaxID=49168 RepID=A0ACC0LV03_RHOML|nr:hypothetical protein RHMOL_Rhmol11G0193000 [Rhododendron molle]
MRSQIRSSTKTVAMLFRRPPKPGENPLDSSSSSSSPSPMPSPSSSLFLSNPSCSLRPFSILIPVSQLHFPTNTQIQNHSRNPNPITDPDKKSFVVATGELFRGIASWFVKPGVRNGRGVVEREKYFWRGRKEGILALVEDDKDMVWERREKDVEAEEERRRRKAVTTSPGFSFSAAGLLFPYYLGDTTPLAGSSAGAIVCAVIASGASMQEALKATKILAKDCRLRGTAFRLGAVLRDVLDKFLPDDVHTRSNGRVRVAVTQILWRPRGLLIDQFDSKEDFINALFTSSFIPGYLAPRPATMFRNKLCIDGGLTLFMPPTSATQTIRVCAFPASRLGYEGIGISPDCNPENRATPRELFNWALEPAEDHILDKLFEDGYSDAAVWAKQNPVEEIVQHDQPHMENDAVS